ncbi:MAG: WG repeat-containing protein [Crocinitomicaceae bacterium]|nr:WG repeat-containing protein [Crocinitomicaceae bacterium]
MSKTAIVPIYFFCLLLLSCSSENTVQNQTVENENQIISSDTIAATDTLPEAIIYDPYLDSFYLDSDYKDGKIRYGYKNRFGERVIKNQFDLAGEFYHGLAPVIKKGKSGLIDTTGKMIYVFEGYELAKWYNELGGYDELYKMDEGMYLVTDKSEKYGYVNSKNELIVPIEYKWGSQFSEGKAVIEKDRKFGFIDSIGNLFGQIEYRYATPFSEGLAAVMQKDKIGFIDHTGNYVIEPAYKSALSFSEGLCAVSYSNEFTNFFFIDKTGQVIIEGPFDNAESFKNGECIVEKRGKSRVIDKTGKELRKLDYDYFAGC